RTRDVPVTSWNGAFLVVAEGPHSTLTGWDAAGRELGSLSSEPGPEPPRPERDEEAYRWWLANRPEGGVPNEPILRIERRPGRKPSGRAGATPGGGGQARGMSVHMPSPGGATGWLNSEPLTPAGLLGKVVLFDFWTLTCINWLRTEPYVRAWARAYRD